MKRNTSTFSEPSGEDLVAEVRHDVVREAERLEHGDRRHRDRQDHGRGDDPRAEQHGLYDVKRVRGERVHVDAAVMHDVDVAEEPRVMQQAVPAVEPRVVEEEARDAPARHHEGRSGPVVQPREPRGVQAHHRTRARRARDERDERVADLATELARIDARGRRDARGPKAHAAEPPDADEEPTDDHEVAEHLRDEVLGEPGQKLSGGGHGVHRARLANATQGCNRSGCITPAIGARAERRPARRPPRRRRSLPPLRRRRRVTRRRADLRSTLCATRTPLLRLGRGGLVPERR